MTTPWVNVDPLAPTSSLFPTPSPATRKHLLIDIVVIAVLRPGVRLRRPTAIHRWAANRLDWLGNSSHFPRASLHAMHPSAVAGAAARSLQKCFQNWIATLYARRRWPDRLVAIDGKTCRGSHDAAKGSARCTSSAPGPAEEGIAWPGRRPRAEINDITAFPSLEAIVLTDALITIDAMGCRKHRVRTSWPATGLRDRRKDNQPKLREAIEAHFEKHLESDLQDLKYPELWDQRAGPRSLDERSYFLSRIPTDFPLKKNGVDQGDRLHRYGYRARRRPSDGPKCVTTCSPLSERQTLQRGGSRSLGKSSRCIGCWMYFARTKAAHGSGPGQQSKLAPTLRG